MNTAASSIPPPASIWQTREVKFYKMDAFFLLTSLLLGKVLILRAIRHRRAWGFVSFLLLAAGYLSTPAMSYVFGLLSDSAVVNDLTILWAVFLVVLDGTVDNTASQSLEDNEATRKRFLWDKMLPSLWLFFLLFFTVPMETFWIPVLLLWVLFILKLREKKLALIYACRSRVGLDRVTTVIVEYMRGESICADRARSGVREEEDLITTTTIQDYRYLVGVKEVLKQVVSPVFPPRHMDNLHPDKLATIDKIWQCEGKLLGSEDMDGRLKDTCLSFALFWRLLPRFADYDRPEASSYKAWKFVSDVLLTKDQDHDRDIGYERVFRVLELELQFLRDYFYTNYFGIYRSGVRFLMVRVVVLAFYMQVSFITLKKIKEAKRKLVPWYDVSNLQLSITNIIIYSLIFVELAHIINMICSRWNKVKWVCSYVQNKWWESRLGKVKEWLLCKLCHQPLFRPCFRPWHRKLRQYSLLDSYRHTPFILRFRWVLDGYMELPMIGQKESALTGLSTHVMEAILLSLHTNGPKLSNGLASLSRNNVDCDLSWACKSNEITHIILVWHIATSMCEKDRRKATSCTPLSLCSSVPEDPNFLVATSLSKYCAYLVAFVPKLLPDHVYMTHWIFEQAVSKARVEFKPQGGLYNGLIKLIKRKGGFNAIRSEQVGDGSSEKGAHPTSLEQDDNIVKMGLLLTEQVKGLGDESVRWKVLADFWAELILFLAPSKYANEHAKHLVTGGEFITHLWALLTHAGIVDRDGLGDN